MRAAQVMTTNVHSVSSDATVFEAAEQLVGAGVSAMPVVDSNGGTEMVFRSGATKAVQPGSWIVNCTGYLMQQDHPYEPSRHATPYPTPIRWRSAIPHSRITLNARCCVERG